MSILKILIVVTNIHIYESDKLDTGLWLSELTHLYHEAITNGYEVTIASPGGGNVPINPQSLKCFTLDNISKQYWKELSFRELLKNNKSLVEVSEQQFDCVYLAGGHGTMMIFLMIPLYRTLSEGTMKQVKSFRQSVTELADY